MKIKCYVTKPTLENFVKVTVRFDIVSIQDTSSSSNLITIHFFSILTAGPAEQYRKNSNVQKNTPHPTNRYVFLFFQVWTSLSK